MTAPSARQRRKRPVKPPLASSPEVTAVAVEGLFGRFSHSVDIDPAGPFRIIIGPNGIGKTRFFELIRAALTLRYRELITTSYDTLQITFSDSTKLVFRREMDGETANVTVELVRGLQVIAAPVEIPAVDERLLRELEHTTPLHRVAPDQWFDPETEEWLDSAEVLQRHRRVNPADELGEEFAPYIRTDAAHLIETQRLIRTRPRLNGSKSRYQAFGRPDSPRELSTVSTYSRELARQLDDRFAESGRIGQQLDRTFASRVLKRKPATSDESTVRSNYNKQLEFRERLVKIGIADPAPEVELPIDTLEAPEIRLMEAYLEDSDSKLSVFNDLLAKIELMQRVIQDKFLYKTFSITRQGFKIHTEDEPHRELPLSALSSGEQHELVLIYSLLFLVNPGSLVMIDEPELSLHVGWQRRFLSDLTGIAELADVRFLIATHSPQIIDTWWDATTELAGGWE